MARLKRIISEEIAYTMPFPTRFRELLSRPNETQEKLASAIGVNRQSVGMWKDGTTSPDINVLAKIADYYHVSADYLLGRIDVQSPDVEVMAICNKTGLSQDALDSLLGVLQPGVDECTRRKHVNRFLSSNVTQHLLLSISTYLEHYKHVGNISAQEVSSMKDAVLKDGAGYAVLDFLEYGNYLRQQSTNLLDTILYTFHLEESAGWDVETWEKVTGKKPDEELFGRTKEKA